ncbi:8-oxo-dGTP diphosphatase [Pelagibaculum spongiae]|nr:8-oxo-dGTP diphosphatase [Pelagibaculum spongiae]
MIELSEQKLDSRFMSSTSNTPGKFSVPFEDNWAPEQRASLVMMVRNDNMLLIHKKRGLGIGKILGPGGRQEPGESMEQCAKRELKEELCIDSGPLRLAGVNRFQFADGLSLEVHIYFGESFEGMPTETAEASPVWYPLGQLPYDKMWPDDEIWIPLMLQNRYFEGDWLFDHESLIDFTLRRVDETA